MPGPMRDLNNRPFKAACDGWAPAILLRSSIRHHAGAFQSHDRKARAPRVNSVVVQDYDRQIIL